MSARDIQYSAAVDPIVYGPGTDGFERAEWVALALAALDQAGVRSRDYEEIQNLLDERGYAMVGDGQTAPTE